jgi:hypothetical protein
MRILYSGWENWLEKKGMEMTVEEDSDKNVMAMWTEDNEAKKKGSGEGEQQ